MKIHKPSTIFLRSLLLLLATSLPLSNLVHAQDTSAAASSSPTTSTAGAASTSAASTSANIYSPYQDGLIPLAPGGRAASDLVKDGAILNPLTAFDLSDKGGLDLSTLNPPTDTSLWQDSVDTKTIHNPIVQTAKELELSKINDATFISTLSSRSLIYRFSISANDALGTPHIYTITLSKTAHNILLRKNLLQKLGYQVPATVWIPQIKIRFADAIQKKVFITDLEQGKLFASKDRWVKNEDDVAFTLDLQDAIITEEQDEIYNLALGYLNNSVIKDRRLLSALLVPYSLTNIPESVNLFSWNGVLIQSENARLDYPDAEQYGTTYEDARWIIDRIAKLNDADWNEIVDQSQFPTEAKLLIIEKLKARRNSLVKVFNITVQDNVQELSYNSKISSGTILKKGKLTQEFWPGYATRFTFGDPESPLNPGEVWAFTKSKFLSIVIENAVGAFNSIPKLSTNIEDEWKKHGNELLSSLQTFAQTGTIQKVPLGVWGYPTYGGRLIFSREVVTGNYMGTDNMVQLSDSFGVQVNIGGYLGLDGLPTSMSVGANAGATFSRVYAHIKPIKSIKKANKYPFKNAFVPLFFSKSGNYLKTILSDDFKKLPDDQQTIEYNKALEQFKKAIEIGESLIITDSITAGVKADAATRLYQFVEIAGSVGVSELIIARIHLHRKDENTFQIYKDFGAATQPSFDIGANLKVGQAGLPMLTLHFGMNRGKTKTELFPVKLSDDQEDRDLNVDLLKTIYHTLKSQSAERVRTKVKPYKIVNKFKQRDFSTHFFALSYKRLRTMTDLTFTTPSLETKEFVHDQFAETLGVDYESMTADAINFIGGLYLKGRLNMSSDATNNPGFTIFGHARNRVLTFEAEKPRLASNTELKDQFVKVAHVWNGWSISKKKAQTIIDKINADYSVDPSSSLFWPTTFNEAEKLFLYNINVNLVLYDKAVKKLTSLTEEDLTTLVASYGLKAHRPRVRRIMNLIDKYKNDQNAKALLKAVNLADKWLPPKALIELLGGRDAIFIYAKIEGFRKGDENGDKAIESNTVGLVGSPKISGPLSVVQDQTGMSEGEILSYWLLERAL